MTSIAQRAMQLGRYEGQQEGRNEGRKEGESTLLLRQLARRFGALSTDLIDRVRQASSGQLEQWADNILDARQLSDVFADK